MLDKIDNQKTMIFFGAHPDDLELSCGGTLLRLKWLGYKVGLVDMTRGERGTRGTAQIRAAEADAAMKVLGADVRENPVAHHLSAVGEMVSSIFAYSVTPPVFAVWNRWFKPGSSLTR